MLTRRIAPALQDELVARFHTDRAERERIEAELEREVGLDPGDVLLYCPSPHMALKEAHVRVEVGASEPVSLSELNLPEISVLLDKHRDLWRFYAFVDSTRPGKAAALAAACARRFGQAAPESD